MVDTQGVISGTGGFKSECSGSVIGADHQQGIDPGERDAGGNELERAISEYRAGSVTAIGRADEHKGIIATDAA